MTKREKLLDRLLTRPIDFTWDELNKVLKGLGYIEDNMGKTSGSRVRFISSKNPPIILHKPHPKPTLKRYQIDQIIEKLRQEKLI